MITTFSREAGCGVEFPLMASHVIVGGASIVGGRDRRELLTRCGGGWSDEGTAETAPGSLTGIAVEKAS